MIEIIAGAGLGLALLFSNGVWWRLTIVRDRRFTARIAATEAGANEERRRHEAAETAITKALQATEATATRAIAQATYAEERAAARTEEMKEMEERFKALPSDLPTPALGRHKHRYNTMLGDGGGWRCGICGEKKAVEV